MAQSSWPFENIDTTETQYSQLFRNLGAGVQGSPGGTELQVSAGLGLGVNVGIGQAMVRGHYYLSNAVEALGLVTANPSLPRLDTIILRLNPTLNTIVLAVLTGTPNASPVAPTLTQTDGAVFEFPLANVLVNASAGVPSTITDRREFLGSRLGIWTTSGRPASPQIGQFGYNTTLSNFDFWNGTAWVGLLSLLPDGAITTAKLADSAVTTIKIADDSVTDDKLAIHNGQYRATESNANTSISVVAADRGKLIFTTSSSAITMTIQSGFGTGERVDILQNGTGQITFAAGAGVTLASRGSRLKSAGQFAGVTLIHLGGGAYRLVGDLAA
jgi:hypothetical protein